VGRHWPLAGRKCPLMSSISPIAVIIPTYDRGAAVHSVMEKLGLCDPQPAEIWIHVDSSDGTLERELNARFPHVHVLSSPTRLGPGGGRHRCLSSCSTPYAVSFDDDSYPIDAEFFGAVERLFATCPDAAILGARVWHRHEAAVARTSDFMRVANFIGCGHAIRLSAYRQVRGYLSRARAYGMEESDLSLQLFAAGWQIYESGELRVFHDTDLSHHDAADVTSGMITNVALFAFLHYPVSAWGWATLQVMNKVLDSIRRHRFRGICLGLLRIPRDCYRNRKFRSPVALPILWRFLQFRRTGEM
jgi:GT2 family glycosyltransferase